MRKIIIITFMLLFVCGVASASGIHGEYKGNPIVVVESEGQALQVEDVPAINYMDRTMVPIYLLKQLGVGMTWDAANYTVDVEMPTARQTQADADTGSQSATDPQPDDAALLRDVYQWLDDMNEDMLAYLQFTQQYLTVDNPQNYAPQLATKSGNLQNEFGKTQTFARNAVAKIKLDNHIEDILIAQLKAMDQVGQTTMLLSTWLSRSDSAELSTLKTRMFFSLDIVQDTIAKTHQMIHETTEKQLSELPSESSST